MFLRRLEGKSIDALICHGGSGGGGSSSGEIGYPIWMQETHHNWLSGDPNQSFPGDDVMDNSIVDLMNVAHGVGGNPYEGETAYDPNVDASVVAASPLGLMDAQFVASKTIMDALDSEVDWESHVDLAATKYTKFSTIDFLDSLSTAINGLLAAVESSLSSSSITDMVTAFENNKKTRFLRDVGMWSAGMADINAVHTSSFIMGLAVQQIEFSNSVDQYERELKANVYTKIIQAGIDAYVKAQVLRVGSEDTMLIQGPDLIGKLEHLKIQAQSQLMQTKAEVERITMVALREETDRQMELEVDESLWDMEAYMYGGNVLGSIAGASAGRKGTQMSRGQTALGGAMAGASIGASFGPWGAGIGFVAGGLLGWLF